MKSSVEPQRPPTQQFKTITTEELPKALRWLNDQRLENHWCLTMQEQLVLLGDISSSLYADWFAQIESANTPLLSDDAVRRLSILVGIHKSLALLVPANRPDYAVKWFLTPNHSSTCAGQSIKDYLLTNNTLSGFRIMEAYLVDAVNGFLGGSYT